MSIIPMKYTSEPLLPVFVLCTKKQVHTGRDLFVRKGWWLGSERAAAAAQYTSHLLSYLTTDWIPRSLRRGKNTDDLGEKLSFRELAACTSPLSVFLPSAALRLMTATVTASSLLSMPAKMWNGVGYRVCWRSFKKKKKKNIYI